MQYEEYKIQGWIRDTAIRNSQNRDGKFIHSITEETETIKISKARFYFNLLDWYPWVLKWALEDAKKIGTDDLRKKYEIEEKIIKTKEISNYALEIEEEIYTDPYGSDLLYEMYDYKLEEKFWEINDKDKVYYFEDLKENLKISKDLYNWITVLIDPENDDSKEKDIVKYDDWV